MTQKTLAKMLEVSLPQLYRLRKDHGLPEIRMGRGIRFLAQDVLKWLEDQKQK